MVTRAEIVKEAESWLGTPYKHRSHIKGVGADCGMMLIKVYSDLGLCEYFDPRPYSNEFHLHRDDEWFLSHVAERFATTDTPGPGDIAMFKVGRIYSHGAVITAYETIDGVVDVFNVIHAMVREHQVQREDCTRHGLLRVAPVQFFYTKGTPR